MLVDTFRVVFDIARSRLARWRSIRASGGYPLEAVGLSIVPA